MSSSTAASQTLSPRLSDIRDALTTLFLERGFRGLDLDAMAAYAKCSKSTLYELAESKDHLVTTCVEFYFRRAGRHVEAAVASEPDPAQRIRTYLMSVADQLSLASTQFLSDVASRATTRGSYERHTAFAATRVRELVDAASGGRSRDGRGGNRAQFLGEVAAATMDAIERGGVSDRTGLTHAQAYAELADVLVQATRARVT
ncbi:TetR/AcrR family transcriptional regulator [Jatrophihabitans fulvus]